MSRQSPKKEINHHDLEKAGALILKGLGVDHLDRNFIDTPERFAKVLVEMFDPPQTEWATFPEKYNDFILLRDHRLFSLCPHHLLPVKLFASIAYIPNGNVLGLSKLARVTAECNRGPLLQEAFTKSVVEFIDKVSGSLGSACLVEGRHGCMEMRGVRSDAHFFTYSFSGAFKENERLQDRFFALSKTPTR